MIRVTILGELTDLNTFINKQRINKYAGNKIKQDNTQKVALAFSQIPILTTPINLKINWYCKNKRKDKDNIAFAIKFILDGMISAKVIENDGWKEIGDFKHKFYVDKDNPRIEIEISEG